MKRVMAILLVTLLVVMSGCSNNQPTASDLTIEEIAKGFFTDFVNKDFEKMVSEYNLSEVVKSKLTKDLLVKIHEQLINTYGEFEEVVEVKTEQVNNLQVVNQISKFKNKTLNIFIPFDSQKIINGFSFTEKKVEAPINEDFIYIGDEFKLKGVLTVPEGEGPFPVLIIIHGSGPQDMNCTVGPNIPYKDIAEELKQKNIAVLRYNKRTFTYGKEFAENNEATVYDEFIYDSQEAVKFLLEQDKIDSKNIFIAGHSQSGYLLPRIAESNPDVKAFIGLAAGIQRIEDAIAVQTEYLINLDGAVTEQEKQILQQSKEAQRLVKDIKNKPDDFRVLGIQKSYWLDLADYEPTEAIKKVKRPVMFLQGERDYQVDMQTFKLWQEATKGLSNFSFKSYPTLNHLFIAGEGQPNPQEYNVKGSVDSTVINDIAEFIRENAS